jgi:flavodoxin
MSILTPAAAPKVLVVYFSRTGDTRRTAQMLAKATSGELCAITENRSRLGLWGYVCSAWEAMLGREASVHTPGCDPAAADLVLIGTPIWGWHLSSPVRAFAREHGSRIRRFAFFCTMGGSGSEAAFAELQQILGQPPLATLALTDAEVDTGSAWPKAEAFARGLMGPDSAKSPVARAATGQVAFQNPPEQHA